MLSSFFQKGFLSLSLILNVFILSNSVSSVAAEVDPYYYNAPPQENDPSYYKLVAKYENRFHEEPFYLDSNFYVNVSFSTLYFKGKHGFIGDYYFVSLNSTDMKGKSLDDVKAYLAIPTTPSPELHKPFTKEAISSIIQTIKPQHPVNLTVSIPTFFFLSDNATADSVSMCMQKKMTQEPASYEPNAFSVTANSGFHLLYVDEAKIEIKYQNFVKLVLSNEQMCDTVPKSLNAFNAYSPIFSFPVSFLPTFAALLDDKTAGSALAALTSLFLFSISHPDDSSLTYEDGRLDLPISYENANLKKIEEITKYLQNRGITVQNEFLLNTDVSLRHIFEKLLKKFSFKLRHGKPGERDHILTQLVTKTLEEEAYSMEERTALDKIRNQEYLIPKELLNLRVPDVKLAMINTIEYEFDWVFKFNLGAHHDVFKGDSGETPTLYHYLKADLQYVDDEVGLFAVTLPIKLLKQNTDSDAVVVLLHIQPNYNGHYSPNHLNYVSGKLINQKPRPITLGIPHFEINESSLFQLSEVPHLGLSITELSFMFNPGELEELQFMQIIRAYINHDGAQFETIVKHVPSATLDGNVKTFDSPFHFFIMDKTMDVELFSHYVKDLPSEE